MNVEQLKSRSTAFSRYLAPPAAALVGLLALSGVNAAVVTIDAVNSVQTATAEDGTTNTDSFQVTGLPFAGSVIVFSPNLMASAVTSLTLAETPTTLVLSLAIAQTLVGDSSATANSGSIQFLLPLPVFNFTVTGDYSTSFDTDGSSNLTVGVGSYSESQQVSAGTGTAFNFGAARGPETVSGLTYNFATTAGGGNNLGSGQLNLQIEFVTALIPLPGSAWLFGSALFGFAMVTRRRPT